MIDVILVLGSWVTMTTLPRPNRGDFIRYKDRQYQVTGIVLVAGSPVIDVVLDSGNGYMYDEKKMIRDGWQRGVWVYRPEQKERIKGLIASRKVGKAASGQSALASHFDKIDVPQQ